MVVLEMEIAHDEKGSKIPTLYKLVPVEQEVGDRAEEPTIYKDPLKTQ